jgi:hypothetical protein
MVSLRLPLYIWIHEDDLPHWHHVKSSLVRYSVRIPDTRRTATMLHLWSAQGSPSPTREPTLLLHWSLRAYVSSPSRLRKTKQLTYLDTGYGGVKRNALTKQKIFGLSRLVRNVVEICRNSWEMQLQKGRTCVTCFLSCYHTLKKDREEDCEKGTLERPMSDT